MTDAKSHTFSRYFSLQQSPSPDKPPSSTTRSRYLPVFFMPGHGPRIKKFKQPSLETSVVSSSSTSATQGQPSIPCFFKIPRELRDRIYSYFVTVDQHFDYKCDKNYVGTNFHDLSITRVNRQIRAEAWDCLIKMNLWVFCHSCRCGQGQRDIRRAHQHLFLGLQPALGAVQTVPS